MPTKPNTHRRPLQLFSQALLLLSLYLGLSLGLVLSLTSCTDGLVLDPVSSFSESEVDVPKSEASASATPSTPMEQMTYRLHQAAGLAQQNKGLVWPILAVIGVLWGLIQLLRWIYLLSTSSPPLS